MEVTCYVYRFWGVDYVKREEVERLLTEADDLRRVQEQAIAERLREQLKNEGYEPCA